MSRSLTNPYVGPRPFSTAEAQRFFGREQEANQLLSLVVAERLTLFYAQSGAGKSSLLQARLRPYLEQAGLIVLPTGRVSGDLPPGMNRVNNIFAFNLMLSLAQGQGDPNSFAEVSLSYFLARLTSDDGQSYYYDAQASPAAVNPAEAAAYVLLIDQFEEIITTHPKHWPERADFFRQLDQAMADDPLLRVVLTLREDYVAALDPYSALLAGKLRARYYMQRMDQVAALAAITQPAALYGRPFAPDVAESLVDNLRQLRTQTQLLPSTEVAPVTALEDSGRQPPALRPRGVSNGSTVGGRVLGQYVEPVQLQVVCYQLWENLKDRPPGPITLEDLETVGNVDKALADFYEQALQKTLVQLRTPPPTSSLLREESDMHSLSASGRRPRDEVSELQLRTWFDRQLITEAGTRGTVYQGPRETAGLSNDAVKLLADQFLLRAEIRAGGTWYELIHDRFVEPILQANRKWEAERLQRNPLAAPTVAWQNDQAKLLAGAQLQAAQDYAKANPLDVTTGEWEFLRESLRQETERVKQAREARRRSLYLAIGGLMVIVVLAGLTLWALNQQVEAEKQAATAQASQADAETQKATAEAAAIQLAKQYEIAQEAQAEAEKQAATAQASQADAETQKATAEAAATTVAEQNEKAQAELHFYQATDPLPRLAELSKLFNRPDPDSQAKARQLFFTLPKVDQLPLLRVADESLLQVGQALLPNLADVNRTGYTDDHLQSLFETLPGLPAANELSAQLQAWLTARQAARDKKYEDARVHYNKLIEKYTHNPALLYERAGVLTALGENQAALADLEQVIILAHNPAYATIGALPVEPEFASGERMIKAVRRLITVNPELVSVFNPMNYPQLAHVGLAPQPTVITDTKGIPMVLVPAGPFKMGSNNGLSTEQPVHQIDLDEFYLDQYEVTNDQFAAFLREQGNGEEDGVPWLAQQFSRLSGTGQDWQVATGYNKHPVTGVSWYGAKAYCEWRGGRLPTEPEWEKAARGDDQRTHPWGEQMTCELANYHPSDSDKGCVGDTTPVGSHPAGVSPYGAYDMVGNVWEWVQSEYRDYPYKADDGRENLDSTNARVLRGGSWLTNDNIARASYRFVHDPNLEIGYFGFRCVGFAPE